MIILIFGLRNKVLYIFLNVGDGIAVGQESEKEMKVLVDLKSIENIDKYQTDGFIASSKEYSCHNDRCYTYDELSIISEFTKDNKLFIVNIDKLLKKKNLI